MFPAMPFGGPVMPVVSSQKPMKIFIDEPDLS
jgi:hypothetical protein